MTSIKPRYYQSDAFNAVKTWLEYREGNPCIVLPTGAGKTIVIAMVAEWVCGWGGRVLLLAHVKELLEQAAEKIESYAPSLKVGVYSAGLDRRETEGQVIIAGIQSVYSKADKLGEFNLVMIDECHLIPSGGDGMYRSMIADLLDINPSTKIVGLTATPYRTTSGDLCGPEEILNAICYEIKVNDLIEQGFLSKLFSKRVIECDTSNLRTRAGEFVAEDVSKQVCDTFVVDAACKEIIERTEERKSVLVFCQDVAHASLVQERLFDSRVIVADTQNRSEIIESFKKREFKYLINVRVLTTGFDAPNVDCVCLLFPTQSPGLYYQICGRGFRLYDGKENCLILDFGSNIERHGPISGIVPPKGTMESTKTKVCPECVEVVKAHVKSCPCCSYEWPLLEQREHELKHGRESSDRDINGDYEPETFKVYDVKYCKHFKKGDPDAPPTMRVEYITQPGLAGRYSRNAIYSEWVCFEHEGYARDKASAWWKLRSNDPMPDSVDRAIDIAEGGGVAHPLEISVEPDKKNQKYTRIVSVKLGDKPEAAPVCEHCDGVGCEECKFEFESGGNDEWSDRQSDGYEISLDDVPF